MRGEGVRSGGVRGEGVRRRGIGSGLVLARLVGGCG